MNDADGRRPRVWLVSARVGAGHVQAARAVQEALEARGGFDVRSVEVMARVPEWFRAAYAGGYAKIVGVAPRLYGRLYAIADADDGPWPSRIEQARIAFEGGLIGALRDELIEARPDWVIHTHFMAPAPFGRWIGEARLPTRQAVVVTDFYPHRIWLARPIDAYCVPSEEAAARIEGLLAAGVNGDDDGAIRRPQIHVTGIPILAKHARPVDAAAVRREFGWPAEGPVILLLSGSDFVVGPFEAVVDQLLRQFPEATLQAAVGNNAVLGRRLQQRAGDNPRLRIIGFTDRMHELIGAATIVVSKSGGITTSECLAHGAVMVCLFAVPGQEERNADYLVERGAGLKVSRLDELVPAVRSVLYDEDRRGALAAAARSIGRPNAAMEVVERTVYSGPNAGTWSESTGVPIRV